MTLKQIMEIKDFVVLGNTIDEEKYAYKIKMALLKNGYSVECVYKEKKSLNEVNMENIEVLDLCINPILGIKYLKECQKIIRVVLIQPGAESEEILSFLKDKKIEYYCGCALVGLSLFGKKDLMIS